MTRIGPNSESGKPEEGADIVQIAPLPRVSIQAFCETPDIAQTVQSASSDRRMEKAHVKVQMGGAAAAVEAYRNAPTPNVILMETDQSRDQVLSYLDRLAEVCDPGTKVIMIGRVNDVLLYRELIRRGVSEYLVAPIDTVELIKTLSDLFRAPDAEPVGRVIAFIGAKGGVGSSTVAHNVSWAIARGMGMDSVVVDMDLPFGTAGLDFNQDPPQGIAEAVFAPDRVDANVIDRLLSKCTENLSLLASPATLDRVYDFHEDVFDPLMDVLRANVPCIILDVPHMWTAWIRRALVLADEIIVVAAPDLANLRNSKNMIDLLRNMRPNDKAPRLLLNQVGVPKRPEIKPSDFAKALDMPPIGAINFEPHLFGTAANNGQMIAEMEASNKVNENFLEMARIITGRSEMRVQKKTLLEPLMAKLAWKKA